MDPIPVTPETLRRMPLPDGSGGKEERGRVLAVGGSRELPGAVLLAGLGILRAGAGKLQIAVPESVSLPVGCHAPEARVIGLPETKAGGIRAEAAGPVLELAERCSAVLLGPGLTVDEDTAGLTRAVLNSLDGPPVVLDAAAMMRVRDDRPGLDRQSGRLILTPHFGEMAGMLGVDKAEIDADPLGTAARAAGELGAVVVLKGACSYIASPDGRTWSCEHGHPGLGTSGSGDTLAGIMAGLLGRGAETEQAAIWAVYLHGEAGHRLAGKVGPIGYLAREIVGEIPAVLGDLCSPACD